MMDQVILDTSLGWMRTMYAVAIFGAGVVGVMTLFAPRLAAQYVFFGATEVNVYLRILAALWLALGITSVFGLVQPAKFGVVFLIQLTYKSLWLVAAALPAIAKGDREVGLLFLTGLFILWVIGLAFAVPFRYLFGAA